MSCSLSSVPSPVVPRGWNDIETYGDSLIDWLRQQSPSLANGIRAASHGCPHSALHCHRYLALKRFWAWMNSALIRVAIIAFDGKVLASSFHREMPRMRFSWSRLTIPKMGWRRLRESNPNRRGNRNRQRYAGHSSAKGAVVTLDALCIVSVRHWRKSARKKAHVVVQVKNNQPKLYQAVQSQFQSLFDAQKAHPDCRRAQREWTMGPGRVRYVFQLKPNYRQS